jgi:hypothetical protein
MAYGWSIDFDGYFFFLMALLSNLRALNNLNYTNCKCCSIIEQRVEQGIYNCGNTSRTTFVKIKNKFWESYKIILRNYTRNDCNCRALYYLPT